MGPALGPDGRHRGLGVGRTVGREREDAILAVRLKRCNWKQLIVTLVEGINDP